ncbi:MAG: MetQ/NlpA family ABC transporter substrate-binding protein [Selenomonadaceae bacterium]|nr:MetQ/NlpA family ABC transporter substrate-binding protein [Selenomonadaceae bacterium]
MKHTKTIFTLLISLVAASMLMAGCGGGTGSSGGADGKTIKIGASAVPHAEILEAAKPLLEQKGIKLEIVEFNDYVQPNLALNSKELDANFFQHKPYLDNFMEEHKDVKLKSVGGIHIAPMGVYSKKVKDLKDLADGAKVSLPNDPTNGGRALLLLAKAGLIKLNPEAGHKATVQDVTDNPKHLQFQEMEAAQIPRSLDDVDAAVINTDYALKVGLVPSKEALILEDSTSPYVNIVAVREGDEERPEIKTLMEVLHSDELKQFILDRYQGAIVPTFTEE